MKGERPAPSLGEVRGELAQQRAEKRAWRERLIAALDAETGAGQRLAAGVPRGDRPLAELAPGPSGGTTEGSGEAAPAGPAPIAAADVQRLVALFAVFREQGISPYPADAGLSDDEVAAMLLAAGTNGLSAAGSPLTSAITSAPRAFLAPEPSDIAPPVPERRARMGVAEATCPTLRPEDDANAALCGRFPQILRDLADMGAGFIRHVQKCDLIWGALFPVGGDHSARESMQDGESVPKPERLLSDIRADDFAVLADATSFLIGCRLSGVKVAFTPFNSGGGMKLTFDQNDLADDSVVKIGTTEILASRLVPGRPDHMAGSVAVISSGGWADWYWEHGVGADSPEGDAAIYQRFVIYVGPTTEYDGSATEAYHQECARRKSLGVAAFSTGIGEWLARVDAALRAWDAAIGSPSEGVLGVVDYIELGNEIDASHYQGASHGLSPTRQERSWIEGGRYMALLAAPIHQAVPRMRFRASELLSPKPDTDNPPGGCTPHEGAPYTEDDCCFGDTFAVQLDWLEGAITTGMESALREWWWLQLDDVGALPAAEAALIDGWRMTSVEAGFYWPPVATLWSEPTLGSVGDLRQQVGFHWYRGVDHSGEDVNVGLYADEVKLAARVRKMKDRFASEGLSVSIGEIGVAMEFPNDESIVQFSPDSFLNNTNEQVQASKLVRTLAAALAAGADRVAWFNFYNGMLKEDAPHEPKAGWTSNFATMGLHHDADFTGNFQSSVGAAEWLWRKPNWYSFQRLAWLLSCAKGGQPTLVVSEDGATLIRVAFGHAPLTGPTGKAMSGSFRVAWLMWLDQYAGSRCRYPNGDGVLPDFMTVRLALGRDAISRPNTDLGLLLMVPAVEATGGPGPLDSAGYRAIDAIDWEWPEWDAALSSWATSTSPDAPAIEIRVLRGRLEAARNLTTPLCILCNLDAGELA